MKTIPKPMPGAPITQTVEDLVNSHNSIANGIVTLQNKPDEITFVDQRGDHVSVSEIIDLKDEIRMIKDRLAILDDPTPEKLEKFKALKKAYERYKHLEQITYEEK